MAPELTFPGLPYIVVYRIEDQVVDVCASTRRAGLALEKSPPSKNREGADLYKCPEASERKFLASEALARSKQESALAARLWKRAFHEPFTNLHESSA